MSLASDSSPWIIYVIELAEDAVAPSKRKAKAAGYVYVGITTKTVEERLTQHLAAEENSGRCFRRARELLDRQLSAKDAWLRLDLVSVEVKGPTKAQAETIERRQANQLKARQWVVLSRHQHGKSSAPRAGR